VAIEVLFSDNSSRRAVLLPRFPAAKLWQDATKPGRRPPGLRVNNM
jgi:hypothetical protein